MFKYQVSYQLLNSIKKITQIITRLEGKRYVVPVLAAYELQANSLSAYSSTSIEGNPLPLTEVKKIIKNAPKNRRETEIEVLNYNDCLIWLNAELKKQSLKFNKNLILAIHKYVMKDLLIKSKVGKFRREPVFVNSPKLRKTIYWPPDHQDVDSLIDELVKFVQENESQMDPLILAGLFHKQFVIIHPFIDGNGRVVRLVTKVLLAQLGFNTFNLFSFENYYNKNVTRYFNSVGILGNYYDEYKNIDFTSWLEYFAEGIIDELLRVEKDLELLIKEPTQVLSIDENRILEFIRAHGFIKDRDYAKITERAKSTRTKDFNRLIALNLIEKCGAGPSVYYKLKV